MSQLSRVNRLKKMHTVSMKNLGDQRLNKGVKGTRIEKVSVIVVD